MTIKEYNENLLNALHIHRNNFNGYGFYEGIEGSLRLAREYGYAMKDFPEKERKDAIQSSYSVIVVKFYNLKPPIDAKDWINEIKKTIIK